jgi:hypothetical protein
VTTRLPTAHRLGASIHPPLPWTVANTAKSHAVLANISHLINLAAAVVIHGLKGAHPLTLQPRWRYPGASQPLGSVEREGSPCPRTKQRGGRMLAPMTLWHSPTSSITRTNVGPCAMIGAFSPPWSERLTALAWHMVTPHLLRSGLYQAGIQNRSGMRPVIVRITREPFGERVRFWCPAGISAEDFLSAGAVLRAACWAADVRIMRDERHSRMVTVDVIRHRHDPAHRPESRNTQAASTNEAAQPRRTSRR